MRRLVLVVLAAVGIPELEAAAKSLPGAPPSAPRRRAIAELPPRGEGYLVPVTWRVRGLSFGVPRLVDLIEQAAAAVQERAPGALLYVADLSTPDGRPTPWHRSHRSGRDADLLFFAIDEQGDPVPPPVQMLRFTPPGVTWVMGEDGEPVQLQLDLPRNWALVRALLEDHEAVVSRIFVAEWIKRELLEWARAQDEPEMLLARAEEVLGQPGDSTPHDDHMHVRIAPAVGDPELVTPLARRGKRIPGRVRVRHPARRGAHGRA